MALKTFRIHLEPGTGSIPLKIKQIIAYIPIYRHINSSTCSRIKRLLENQNLRRIIKEDEEYSDP